MGVLSDNSDYEEQIIKLGERIDELEQVLHVRGKEHMNQLKELKRLEGLMLKKKTCGHKLIEQPRGHVVCKYCLLTEGEIGYE